MTTHVLEGKSLAQQARIYFNATIIIQTHGAALGGWHTRLRPAGLLMLLTCNCLNDLALQLPDLLVCPPPR